MVALNSKSEVADFLDVSQFLPSHSAYECVAYCGALVKYCGPPGKGATGTVLQASNLAQYWYGREEGSTDASNRNGMSLQAEKDMLVGMGLKYQALSSVQDIKDTLAQQGYPVLLCGAETGMVDMGLGESVPYSWTPTGNHCILVSGVASDGNLLVHDCASIGPSGVRPGPRTYDASKISLVSATAVIPAWQGDEMSPSLTSSMSAVAAYFTQSSPTSWHCTKTNKVLLGGMLSYYQTCGASELHGLLDLGLPVSNEVAIEKIDASYQHLAGSGIVVQFFERGVLVYDVKHVIDNPPGSGSVYRAHLYGLPGQDPLIKELQAQLAQQPTPVADTSAQEALQAELDAANGKVADLEKKIQAAEAALSA